MICLSANVAVCGFFSLSGDEQEVMQMEQDAKKRRIGKLRMAQGIKDFFQEDTKSKIFSFHPKPLILGKKQFQTDTSKKSLAHSFIFIGQTVFTDIFIVLIFFYIRSMRQ